MYFVLIFAFCWLYLLREGVRDAREKKRFGAFGHHSGAYVFLCIAFLIGLNHRAPFPNPGIYICLGGSLFLQMFSVLLASRLWPHCPKCGSRYCDHFVRDEEGLERYLRCPNPECGDVRSV